MSRTTEGSGLGLSIAKSLTQLQKGLFQIIIDGDLFKAMVAFPVERVEHKADKALSDGGGNPPSEEAGEADLAGGEQAEEKTP